MDLITLRKSLLGKAPLPAANMSFIAKGELVLSLVKDPAGLAEVHFDCRNNASYNRKRYVIKWDNVFIYTGI